MHGKYMQEIVAVSFAQQPLNLTKALQCLKERSKQVFVVDDICCHNKIWRLPFTGQALPPCPPNKGEASCTAICLGKGGLVKSYIPRQQILLATQNEGV